MTFSSAAIAPSVPRRLSQGHLTLLDTCARKFQHLVLEQLGMPIPPDQQERLQAGANFHQLMQQWQMGLPVERLLQDNDQLQNWFQQFQTAAPDILTLEGTEADVQQQSEHQRTLEFQGYLLTVIYDLLLTSPSQARILDWKTYPRPQSPQRLQQHWQTRLYLFVLAETSAYQPEHLSMVYWFFQSQITSPSSPQSFTITYDSAQHEQTQQDLTRLLAKLSDWLVNYQAGQPFPKTPTTEPCQTCNFALRCGRSQLNETNLLVQSPSLLDITGIQEVPLSHYL